MATNKGFQVFKRSADGDSLGVSIKTELHQVDLICSHCDSNMQESICDRHSFIEQTAQIFINSGFAHSIKLVIAYPVWKNIAVGDFVEVIGYLESIFDFEGRSPTRNPVFNVYHISKIQYVL